MSCIKRWSRYYIHAPQGHTCQECFTLKSFKFCTFTFLWVSMSFNFIDFSNNSIFEIKKKQLIPSFYIIILLLSLQVNKTLWKLNIIYHKFTSMNTSWLKTFGSWGPRDLKFVKEIGRKIQEKTGNKNATSHIIHTISMTVKRGNTTSIKKNWRLFWCDLSSKRGIINDLKSYNSL